MRTYLEVFASIYGGAVRIQTVSDVRVHPEDSDLKSARLPLIQTALSVSVPELQLLRAIGCLLVFAVHSVAILFPALLPLPAERAGTDYLPHAVIGFFILSGLVLALPFVGEAPQRFRTGKFYYERLFRLYPLYWLSILFALGLRFAVTRWVGLPAITPWPGQFWSVPLTPRILLEHFAGFLDPGKAINPAYWTLANEIQACIFFPLVVMLVRRTRHWAFSVIAIVGTIVAPHYLPGIDVVRTLGYFVMGAYVAKYNQPLKMWLQNLPRTFVWASAALLLAFFWIAPGSGLLFRISFPLFNVLLALLMVAVQAFNPLAVIARLRPAQRMADLSYCFYLTHLPILATCAFVLEPRLHAPVLTALVGFSLSILVAWILWRLVETPIRRWAKRSTTESAALATQGLVARETAAS